MKNISLLQMKKHIYLETSADNQGQTEFNRGFPQYIQEKYVIAMQLRLGYLHVLPN